MIPNMYIIQLNATISKFSEIHAQIAATAPTALKIIDSDEFYMLTSESKFLSKFGMNSIVKDTAQVEKHGQIDRIGK